MNDFTFYFNLGWQHIVSWDSLDHILFITALSAIYLVKDWKQVLILVTAFTIGHSLTLALSVYDLIRFNSRWVEFLIPVTILTTSIFNFCLRQYNTRSLRINYLLALFFGLIHGMGFANTIRFMLSKGEHIALPLVSFNIGLEVGQIAVVSTILLCGYLVVTTAGMPRRWWVWSLSGIALLIATNMAIKRMPF